MPLVCCLLTPVFCQMSVSIALTHSNTQQFLSKAIECRLTHKMLQYHSNVSYHHLVRCALFLPRCVLFLLGCAVFLSGHIMSYSSLVSLQTHLISFGSFLISFEYIVGTNGLHCNASVRIQFCECWLLL